MRKSFQMGCSYRFERRQRVTTSRKHLACARRPKCQHQSVPHSASHAKRRLWAVRSRHAARRRINDPHVGRTNGSVHRCGGPPPASRVGRGPSEASMCFGLLKGRERKRDRERAASRRRGRTSKTSGAASPCPARRLARSEPDGRWERATGSPLRPRSAGKRQGSLHLGFRARAATWRPGDGCGQSDPSRRKSPAGEVRERPNRSHC